MPHRAIALMSDEDKLTLAQTYWMVAFDAAVKACKEEEFSSEITFTAMVKAMTSVLTMLVEGDKE